ncbi:MAG: hypothetical protein WBP22_01610 [Candidatus Saccharimonas sp.]|jgi:hypothetical protein
MSERSATIRQVEDDPSGSIFLPNIETIEDYWRVRQQVIFGRGVYRSARLSVDGIEWLLSELDRAAEHIG